MTKKITKRHILSAILLLVIIIALTSPADYISGTLGALLLYAKNVLPALFPFIFFNKMLTMLGTANDLSSVLKKPIERIYHAPAVTGYVMFMSILCGYPIGSKMTSDLYNSGAISQAQCNIVHTLSSVCGPIFIIGTVSSLLGSSTYGYVIYAAHIIASLINGFIYRPRKLQHSAEQLCTPSCDDILGKSMTDSIVSIAIVGGYIMIMSFFITMSDKLHITKLVTSAFSYIGADSEYVTAVWYGLFEMTRGIGALSACQLPPIVILPTASFLVTFGGAAIALQSLNYAGKCGITTAKYLLSKLTQAIIATAVCIVFCLFILQ